MNRTTVWLKCRPANGHPHVRLFILPHAGGGAAAFHSWSASLPVTVQVCSVLLPGRESRFSEPLYYQMEPLLDAMDRELRPWLDIPYVVFGHSMGALLAFEWARRLQRDGQGMPAWAFLSGRRAPDAPGDTSLLQALSDHDFVQEVSRRYGGIPHEFIRNASFNEIFLPALRADIALVESYHFQESEPLDCPITVFAGVEDASVSSELLLAWKHHTRRRFAMQLFPGGHFYPQRPLLQAISSTLDKLHS